MGLNKKQKLFIFFLVFLMIIYGIYLLYYSNKPKDLNVLLITIDALRPDHLGCYGYKRNTSPNIDKLAKEGVLFTQAITQSTWTGSSLPSLLSSTYPSTHKIEDFGNTLDGKLLTIAEILKKKDYYTAWINQGIRPNRMFPGLERGFSSFISTLEANEAIQQTMVWLKKFQNKKFFIWIHFFEYPHAPYIPPHPFNALFMVNSNSKHIPIGKGGKGQESMGVIPEWVAVNNITDVDYYISQYDGEIAFVDSLVGKILDALKTTKLNKKTIVIISADHGESLGERNVYFQHGDCLYNEQIMVPLIIRGKTIPAGKIIEFPVELIDIMPSILDILGIEIDTNCEGTSFAPLILGKKKNYSNNFVFSEAGVTKIIEKSLLNAEQKCIITKEWKLIYEISKHGIRYELYNLKTDPRELNNLVEAEKEQFKFLKAKLEEWMNRPKPDVVSFKKPLDEETKEKLRSLGYVQ